MLSFLNHKGHTSVSCAKGGGGTAIVNTKSTSFNGSDESCNVTDSTLILTTSLAYSAWIKTSASSAQFIMGQWSYTDSNTSTQLRVQASGIITFYGSPDGSAFTQWDTVATVNDGNWHHIVVTWSANNEAQVYIDGSAVTTNRSAGNLLSSLHGTLRAFTIGAASSLTPLVFFSGNIDEASVFSSLTAAQITAIYNSGSPNNLQALSSWANNVSWWRMGDGDTSPTISDQNSNGNDLTTVNMAASNFASDTP